MVRKHDVSEHLHDGCVVRTRELQQHIATSLAQRCSAEPQAVCADYVNQFDGETVAGWVSDIDRRFALTDFVEPRNNTEYNKVREATLLADPL